MARWYADHPYKMGLKNIEGSIPSSPTLLIKGLLLCKLTLILIPIVGKLRELKI